MTEDRLSRFSISSKEKEKLLRGHPASFPVDAYLSSARVSKSNGSDKTQKNGVVYSTHKGEGEKQNSTQNLAIETTKLREDVTMRKRSEDEGNYISETENESDFDLLGSRVGENSDIDVTERVNRIYESLSSFNERFRNFDALTSSRLSIAQEHSPASILSSKAPVSVRSSDKVENKKDSVKKVSANARSTKAGKKGGKEEKKKGRDPRRDVTMVVSKMFGLDPMSIVGESSVDDDEDTSMSQFQSQSEPLSGSTDRQQKGKKAERRHNVKTQPQISNQTNSGGSVDNMIPDSDDDAPNLGPVMPLLSDKKFLHKLQQREGRMTKEMNDMKNHLDVINTDVEKALRKAKVDADIRKGQNLKVLPKKSTANAPGTVKKLLGKMPNANEGPSKKLTEFLQANGGLTGGWTHDDHTVFMRTYLKWKDRPIRMLDIVTKLLPHKSSQEVMAHVSWYDQYDALHKTNQAYIRQWRINKRQEQEMIYRMASEGQKANLEATKRRQELLQATRHQERERNRSRLSNWKKSTKRTGTAATESDDERKLYLEEFMKKNANISIMNVRKKLEALTEQRIKDSEYFPDSPRTLNLKSFSKTMRDRSAQSQSISTRSSSGVFTDTNEPKRNSNDNVKKGTIAFMRIGPPNLNDENEPDEGHLPNIHDAVKIGRGSKLLMQFRSRDNKMLQARKEAIDNVKSRLKKTLTGEDVRKRVGARKMESPSTVMRETKGWTIRKEIRQTEREEAENEKFQRSLPSAKRSMQPVPFVNHIPKLATPNWRNM